MSIPTLHDVDSFGGKRVLVRVDMNVPIIEGVIVDDFRIVKVLPTIHEVIKKEGKVILLSHHSTKDQSLALVADYLAQHVNVRFVEDIIDEYAFEGQDNNEVILCENLRFHEGEEANDHSFAQLLASRGDVYINDAFGVSHRPHASIVSLPTLVPSYMGLLFAREVEHLSRAFTPPSPSLMILGGAKISSKLPLVHSLIDTFDTIFIGGALANNFFKEQGHEIGISLYDEEQDNLQGLLETGKVLLPIDVVTSCGGDRTVRRIGEIQSGEKIIDAGPETVAMLAAQVAKANFILMNGPLGEYTTPGCEEATLGVVDHVARSESFSVTGGGDIVALITMGGRLDAFDFVSTGGGAMIEFLIHKTLPGIEAL